MRTRDRSLSRPYSLSTQLSTSRYTLQTMNVVISTVYSAQALLLIRQRLGRVIYWELLWLSTTESFGEHIARRRARSLATSIDYDHHDM